MSDEPRVTRIRRNRLTRINDIGRAAIAKFLDPDYAFTVTDLDPGDRVTLTVTVTVAGGAPHENGIAQVHLELPAGMLEEVR